MPSGNRAQVILHICVDDQSYTVSKIFDHIYSKELTIAEMTQMVQAMCNGKALIEDVEILVWCHTCGYDDRKNPQKKVCDCGD